MERCRDELQMLQEDKEKTIEEFLEQHAEEKFAAQQEIKTKYNRMLNMLKNSKDPNKESKIKKYEENQQ